MQAAKLLSKLEDNSRQQWGGAVGYICPGGAAAFALADQLIVAQAGHLYHTVGVALSPDVDPTEVSARARTAASPVFRAIASSVVD
jgi:anthranilate/para-aminobenzoate synthase component I